MIEYVNEAGEVTMGTNFGEAYDKEWALLDQGRRDGLEEGLEKGLEKGREEGLEKGREEGEKNIIINMYKSELSKEEISKMTGIEIEKIEKYISK